MANMDAPTGGVPLTIITPNDVRASIGRAKRDLEKAAVEIVWQLEMEGWRTLGYKTWSAMREAEYGGAAFMVPGKQGYAMLRLAAARRSLPKVRRQDSVTCKMCGEAFAPVRSSAVYCSSACRQRAYRQRSG